MAWSKHIIHILSRTPSWLCLTAALLLIFSQILLRAWVAEDAYISFRVIENFMDGYGLRWNVHERVQVFTHPLWMLLHIPIYTIWGNLYHSNIALSVACSMGAIIIAFRTVDRPFLWQLSLLLLPLFLSKSFMDYTTSGLETPLCYLIFAVFGYVLVRMREHKHFWFYISLSVALALCNRMDNIIIYAPIMLYLIVANRRQVQWDQLLLGGTPFIAWLYFALWYYGFIFPNTKYAKLDTGMPLALYLQQSLNYIKHFLMFDLAGLIILASSVLFIFRKHAVSAFIALGVYAYFLYILYVGGDYMAGRFWAFPIFVSLWLWYVFPPVPLRFDIMITLVCAISTAYFISPMLRSINHDCKSCISTKSRIINARGTFHRNKLVRKTDPFKIRKRGTYPFCAAGKKLADKNPPIEIMFFVGMHAYCAGPTLRAIDMLGLGDALLARLPARKGRGFYIGHFRRKVPRGYPYAVDTGFTTLMDRPLANYYKKLREITSGDLMDRNRLKTIMLFNLGYYDHFKQEYLNAKK